MESSLNKKEVGWIMAILALIAVFYGTVAYDIESIGQYPSKKFIWTHNVTNITFLSHVTRDCQLFCDVIWVYEDICKVEVRLFESKGPSCENKEVCEVTCEVLDDKNLSISTSITIRDYITKNSNVSLYDDNLLNSSINATQLITIEYCDTLISTQDVLKIDGAVNASFSDVSEYSCSRQPAAFVVNNNYTNTYVSYHRTCGYMTQWNGSDIVSCTYAPSPELEISNSTYYLKNYQYYMNETIKLNCTGDPGFPEVNETKYILTRTDGNRETVSPDLPLNSTYDQATIWCETDNKYTLVVNTTISSIESNKIIIDVFYPPMSSFLHRTEVVSVGHNFTLWFFFTSNPSVTEENLTLMFTTYNGTAKNLPDNIIPVQNYSNGKKQNFTYEIINVTKSNLGKYSLEVRSTDPVQQNEILNMYVELTDIPFTTNAPETPNSTPAPFPLGAVIGGAVAGLLILVVIIVYFLVKFKRNKSSATEKASDKEEKDNPLYGTTARDGGAAVVYAADKTGHASSSKEERLNPLYDSNSATQGGVEEAYAAVDVRKKKKKNKVDKGNENAAFSSESNAAVYAAVDKSKKKKNDKPPVEAVYSEVNKKKGSKNDTTLHGSSQ